MIGQSNRLDEMKNWRKEVDGSRGGSWRFQCGFLFGLHAWIYMEIPCTPRLTLIEGIPTRKGFCKIRALMKTFPTRKDLLCYRTNVNPTYYKNPKTLTNQGTHNFPSFNTLELWKFSNLIFKWYLVGSTLVLSTRSSLFLFRRYCLEHVRTVWLFYDFRHHQLASSMGTLRDL